MQEIFRIISLVIGGNKFSTNITDNGIDNRARQLSTPEAR
jgi:hypothetical protein